MVSKNPVKRTDYFFIIFLVLLCILLFKNLGNQYLWQDEAENAVIARNILRYGYPKAYDGTLLVVSDIGYRENYTWIFQPWLQNYVTALSFLILGQSTYSARFPFAIIGICSFILSYRLAKRIFSVNTARVSSVILSTCVPYLLMVRQSRYYSLALFFALLLIHGYIDYTEKKKFSEIKILASSFFLFNSNFGLFFPIISSLIIHYIIFYKNKTDVKKDTGLLFLIIFATMPVFVYFKGWLHKVPVSPDFVFGNIKFYLRSINRYITPIRFMAILYLTAALLKRKLYLFGINYSEKKSLALIFIIFFISVFFMGAAKFRSLRYVIYLIPLLVMFESFILNIWFKKNKILASACIAALAVTNIFSFSTNDFRIRSYFFDYLYEITHDYDGPIERIVEYLRKNARQNDTVKIPYGDCAVAFYTGLKVDNKLIPGDNPYPEWIIPRDYWTSEDFYKTDYFKEIQKRYNKIVLDCPDLRWENRPDDLSYHKFRTVKDYPKKVIIYRLL